MDKKKPKNKDKQPSSSKKGAEKKSKKSSAEQQCKAEKSAKSTKSKSAKVAEKSATRKGGKHAKPTEKGSPKKSAAKKEPQPSQATTKDVAKKEKTTTNKKTQQAQKPERKDKGKSKAKDANEKKMQDTESEVDEEEEVQEEEEEEEEKERSKVKKDRLEFTKPTINQMIRGQDRFKKEKRQRPLSTDEFITSKEFELFNDEIGELNSGISTLKMSYGSVIRSLLAMQKAQRYDDDEERSSSEKKRAATSKGGEPNFLTSLNDTNKSDLTQRATCLELENKYDLELFVNPITREQTFQMLFDEVDTLNAKTARLRTGFFDSKGYFLRQKYEAQTEIRVQRAQLNEFWLWTRKLISVVDDIARGYNDDLLNYFRLH